jgi:HK97 family phage major capsid protein
MMATTEELLQDISDRMAAIEKGLPEDQLRAFVTDFLGGLDDNDPIVRKMRFSTETPELIGSKFARWNYTPADVEFLYDLVQGSRSRTGNDPSEELTKAFCTVSDAMYMSQEEIREIDRQAIDDLFPRVTKHNRAAFEAAIRAMDTAESGYGQQLVGAQYVGDLWEASRPDSRVFGLLNSFEMTAPTAYLPVEVDIPEMIYVQESAANNSANYATQKTGSNRVQVDAKKFVIHQMWSGEMEEDSIIPFIPFLRAQLSKSLAHYSDSLVINGDTTATATGNINSDDATPTAGKHYLALDGIRHAALVDATSNSTNALIGASLAMEDLLAAKGRLVDYTYLHDWGHPTSADDLVFVADPATADKIAALDAVKQARLYNGGRDLLSGQVSDILGHPVISSIAIPKTEADGKVSAATPANNVKGTILYFNRRGLTVGWRRRVKLETERIIGTDQTRLVASLRLGTGRYTPTGAASGIKYAGAIYNI